MSQLPDPATVMAALNDWAIELDQLGKDTEQAHLDLGEAEAAWEEALDEALIEIIEDYERREMRLPGEDIRLALARKRIGFETYATYRKAKRRVEGLEKHGRKLETAVSARQSTLRGIQEEARMPAVNPTTGEIIGGRRCAES